MTEKMYTAEELRDRVRGAVEHRAMWMGLIYLEGKKVGYDAEGIIRAAITRMGEIQGGMVKEQLENPDDVRQFRAGFMNPVTSSVFAIDIKNEEQNDLKVEFNYCALVEGWKKLGVDQETMELLCDIAMDGDRAIARTMGYGFELGDTIAQKCPVCKIRFSKEK